MQEFNVIVWEPIKEDSVTGYRANLMRDLYAVIDEWDGFSELRLEGPFIAISDELARIPIHRLSMVFSDSELAKAGVNCLIGSINQYINSPEKFPLTDAAANLKNRIIRMFLALYNMREGGDYRIIGNHTNLEVYVNSAFKFRLRELVRVVEFFVPNSLSVEFKFVSDRHSVFVTGSSEKGVSDGISSL